MNAGEVTDGALSLRLQLSYRFDSRIDSFCARALQSDVLPVPGGPECSEKSVMTREFKHHHPPPQTMNNEITNGAPHELFTMKQHNTVPRNQVAVHVFVREENGCCHVIQQLQEKKINVMFKSTQQCMRHIFPSRMIYLCFNFPIIHQTLPNPIEFSCQKQKTSSLYKCKVKTHLLKSLISFHCVGKFIVVSSAALPAGSNQWLAAVSSSSSSRVSMLGPSSFRVNMWTESEHFSKSRGWIENQINDRFKQYFHFFLKWQ